MFESGEGSPGKLGMKSCTCTYLQTFNSTPRYIGLSIVLVHLPGMIHEIHKLDASSRFLQYGRL